MNEHRHTELIKFPADITERTDYHPVMLISPPGCGKNAAVSAFATKIGYSYHELVVGQEDAVDMLGAVVPGANRTVSRWVPEWLDLACNKPTVLLVDEITAASHEQVAAALKLCDDSRLIGGRRLHPKTLVIAAMNPPEMAAGAARGLQLPVVSRFEHQRIGAEYAVDWMSHQPGLLGQVGGFLKRNPTAAIPTKAETWRELRANGMPFPCPRQWTRAADAYPTDFNAWSRFVGDAVTDEWMAFARNSDLPDYRKIIDGSFTAVPKRGDYIFVVALAIGNEKSLTASEVTRCLDWFIACAEAGNFGEIRDGITRLRGSHREKVVKSPAWKKMLSSPQMRDALVEDVTR